MTYTQYFVDPHLTSGGHDGEYMVVSEDYADIGDLLPTPGTFKVVSRNLTETEAKTKADSLQRQSYAETRRAQEKDNAQG